MLYPPGGRKKAGNDTAKPLRRQSAVRKSRGNRARVAEFILETEVDDLAFRPDHVQPIEHALPESAAHDVLFQRYDEVALPRHAAQHIRIERFDETRVDQAAVDPAIRSFEFKTAAFFYTNVIYSHGFQSLDKANTLPIVMPSASFVVS